MSNKYWLNKLSYKWILTPCLHNMYLISLSEYSLRGEASSSIKTKGYSAIYTTDIH